MSIIKYKRIFSTLATSSGGGGGGSTITVTTNYSSLPAASSVSGQFYWCSNNDGVHLTGIYYSNGTSWEYNPADDITVVSNYSSLPAANTVPAQFYWCSNSQGTRWLPGSLGGTYYSAGLYFSNGATWEFLDVPYQATQAEVDAGTNTDKFVTPSTFANASKWGSYVPYTGATGDVDLGAHALNANSVKINGTAGNGHIDLKHQSADATSPTSSTALWADANGDIKWKIDGNYKTTLATSANTADRTYTYPDIDSSLAIFSRTPIGNTDTTITTYAKEVVTSVAFTAARNWTLPSASPAGWIIQILDEFQTVTSTNTLTIKVATGKYLNGVLNGTEIIQTAGAGRMLYTDGSGNWAFDAGIKIGETIIFGAATTNPAQNTTYYFGTVQSLALTASATARTFKFLHAGTIDEAILLISTSNSASSENCTLQLYDVTTASAVATIGTFTYDAGVNGNKFFAFTGLSASVNTTDIYAIRIITATTFATAPTGALHSLRLKTKY